MTRPNPPKLVGPPAPAKRMSVRELGTVLAVMTLFVATGVGVILSSAEAASVAVGIGILVSVVVFAVSSRRDEDNG